MKVITGTEGFPDNPGFVGVALGNFDGVHRGHQHLIRAMVSKAKAEGGTSVVFTFQPHPLKVLQRKKSLTLLSGLADKEDAISRLEVDYFLLYPFNRMTAEMHPVEFVEEILIRGLHASHVFVGFNYNFGKKAAGTPKLLREICARHGCEVTVIPAVTIDGTCVSSTLIRAQLLAGDVAQSGKLLGHYHRISGQVVRGEGLGRRLGYPTANLRLEEEVVIPAHGVYAVKVTTDGGIFDGVTNIGHRPTIAHDLPWTIEIHLLHQNIDLYGQTIRVSFVDRLRSEQRFASQAELAAQISRDALQAENILRSVDPANL